VAAEYDVEEKPMKRIAFLSVMVLMVVSFAGCKKGNVSIKTSQIETNTMLIKSDGTVQAAVVESFDKDYYDLEELKTFINERVAQFNKNAGKENAVVLDSLEKKKGNAVMVLQYDNMEDYAKFNETDAQYLTSITQDTLSQIPDMLKTPDGEKTISKEELLTMKNVKVVILNEEYHLILPENIQYYTGGDLTGKKEIDAAAQGCVVVY